MTRPTWSAPRRPNRSPRLPAVSSRPGEHQRVGVDHPLELAVRRVELARQRRDGDVEDRVVEHDHEQAEAQDEQDQPAPLVRVLLHPFREAHRSTALSVTAVRAAVLHPAIPKRNRFVSERGNLRLDPTGSSSSGDQAHRADCTDHRGLRPLLPGRTHSRRGPGLRAVGQPGRSRGPGAGCFPRGRISGGTRSTTPVRTCAKPSRTWPTSRFRRLGRESCAARPAARPAPGFSELAPDDAEFWRAVARARAATARGRCAVLRRRPVRRPDRRDAWGSPPGTVKSTLHDARAAALALALGESYSEEDP